MSDETGWPPTGPELGAAGAELEDLAEIGRGGFAVVYRAHQPRFGRDVAVKVVSASADPLSARRFEAECRAMGTLSAHPNIVTVYDAGFAPNGDPYLLMEFLKAGSLEDRVVRDGPMPWVEVLDVGVKLAGALETAHDATILHRDIKPANVLVSEFGEPCLSDFGLARFSGASSTAGGVTATINHAPPEIFEGGRASTASDVYSLGSTLFTLLTARAPFARPGDENVLSILRRIANDPVPDLRPEGVPAPVCAVIERAMSKDPFARHGSALELAEDLREAQRALGVDVTPVRVSRREAEAVARALDAASDPADPDTTIHLRPKPDPSPTVDVHAASAAAEAPAAVEGAPAEAPPAERPGRRRRLGWAVAAVLVLVAGSVAALALVGGGNDDGGGGVDDTTVTTAPVTRAAAEADLTDQINSFREAQGLDPLETDADLQAAAQAHAQEVAAAGELLQSDLQALSDQFPGQFTILSENVLSGSSVDEIQRDSEASTDPRANLEQTDVDSLGVGIAFSDDRETLWAVEYFGQRTG